MTTSEPKRILIVDDHPMLRRGLSALIGSDPGLTVCGQADSHSAALRFIAACGEKRPALAIVDLGLENGRDGLDLIKDLKATYPEILTLVLSMHDESLYAERAIKAGARGYLSKNQLDETILSAIHRVLASGLYLSAAMGAKIAEKYLVGGATPSGYPSLGDLTDRHLEVFRLLGKGLSTREIAERLHLSPKTVESHREHIKQKLSLHSGAELVRRATLWVRSGDAS